MGRLWPIALIAVVFGGLGLSSVLESSPHASAAATDVQTRLDAIPMTLADAAGGTWVAESTAIPPKHLAIAEAQAHLSRVYTHSSGKLDAVALLLLYGEPGPLGAHTPETCYAGAGFTQLGRAAARELAGGRFWTALFQTTAEPPSTLNVNWSWGTDAGNGWRASENARFDFARESRIFKLYVSHRQPTGAASNTPADRLTPLFLAELQARLAAPPAANTLPPAGVGVPQ